MQQFCASIPAERQIRRISKVLGQGKGSASLAKNWLHDLLLLAFSGELALPGGFHFDRGSNMHTVLSYRQAESHLPTLETRI